MEQTKKYYSEINIARGIAVLLVLLGHSFPDAQTGFLYPGAWWVFDSMYAFHMALFFMLSGFVTGKKVYAGDGVWKTEVIKKCQRLLVPYLVYSLITMVLKVFMNDYANNPFRLSDLWKILIGKNPNGGLWYLWTLFMIFIIVFALSKLMKKWDDTKKTIFLLGFGVVCYLVYRFLPTGFLNHIFRYMVFYNLGIVCFRYYDKVKNRLKLWLAIPAIIMVFVLECPFLPIGKPEYFVTAMLGSYAILAFAVMISRNGSGKLFDFFDFAGNYSYDIYVLSYFVQVPIRVIFWRMLGINYWVIVALMLVCGFVVPVVISKYIIRKNGVLRKLFIGDWSRIEKRKIPE